MAAQLQGSAEFCRRVQAGLADASFEQRRQLVELLIDRVVVTEDEVEIRYVIPTGPRGEQTRFCHLRLDYFDRPALAVHAEDLGCLLRGGHRPVGDEPPRLLVRPRQPHLHHRWCRAPSARVRTSSW